MGDPARPTEDGDTSLKTYHDRIYALVRRPSGESGSYEYVPQDVRLDRPLAYGVSIPTEQGLVCIGGERKTHEVDPQDSSKVDTHLEQLSGFVREISGDRAPGFRSPPSDESRVGLWRDSNWRGP